MSLPDHLIEAAKLAYQEGKISEDRLDDITCHRRLKRFARFRFSKFKKLSFDDKVAIAEHAAFFSINPIDPVIGALAQERVEAWNGDEVYGGSFSITGNPLDTVDIIQHYLGSTGAQEGPRLRTRHLRLSTLGLDQAARMLMPHLPEGMAWTVTGGAYTSRRHQSGQRTPSNAEAWLLEQFVLIEPVLLNNLSAAHGIIREVINRTTPHPKVNPAPS